MSRLNSMICGSDSAARDIDADAIHAAEAHSIASVNIRKRRNSRGVMLLILANLEFCSSFFKRLARTTFDISL